jgi:uncharacterized membrane protein
LAVLIVLFGSWLIFRGIGALGVPALAAWQDSARYALAVMFVFTGVGHFTKLRHDFARMVPRMFPSPMALVYITGVLELLGAAGLLLPKFRAVAGLCLIALLVAMFPANMRAAFNHMEVAGRAATPLWLRAPIQLLFIGLLLWSTRP